VQARRLSEENRSLRLQQEQLATERSTLLAKNEQARARVEAMIARLKSLEQHT
jgi:cell division protein ZapB